MFDENECCIYLVTLRFELFWYSKATILHFKNGAFNHGKRRV